MNILLEKVWTQDMQYITPLLITPENPVFTVRNIYMALLPDSHVPARDYILTAKAIIERTRNLNIYIGIPRCPFKLCPPDFFTDFIIDELI